MRRRAAAAGSTNDVLGKLRMCAAPRTRLVDRPRAASYMGLPGAHVSARRKPACPPPLSPPPTIVCHTLHHVISTRRALSTRRRVVCTRGLCLQTRAKDGRVSLNCLARIYSCWPHLGAMIHPARRSSSRANRACRRRELLVRLCEGDAVQCRHGDTGSARRDIGRAGGRPPISTLLGGVPAARLRCSTRPQHPTQAGRRRSKRQQQCRRRLGHVHASDGVSVLADRGRHQTVQDPAAESAARRWGFAGQPWGGPRTVGGSSQGRRAKGHGPSDGSILRCFREQGCHRASATGRPEPAEQTNGASQDVLLSLRTVLTMPCRGIA